MVMVLAPKKVEKPVTKPAVAKPAKVAKPVENTAEKIETPVTE